MLRLIDKAGWIVPAVLAVTASVACGAVLIEPHVNRSMAPFHFITADGSEYSSSDFVGKVVIVNVWASWCGPCKAELPRLDAYYRMRKDAGLRVVAVTTEDTIPTDRLKAITAGWSMMATSRFHGMYGPLGGLPTNYIIDRAGMLRYAKSGALNGSDLQILVEPLLAEPAPVSLNNG